MSSNRFRLKKNNKQQEKEYKEEIASLKSRINDLESITMPLQPIGYADAQVYCIECGHIEYYNFYNPLTAPRKCSKCGGRMTDKQTEDIRNSLIEHLKKRKQKRMTLKQPNKDIWLYNIDSHP